ncbi:coactosin-like protein [Diadema antillarum]|uniref:coactosin-like protein n=1 Tax=Diadema antillarum TaxID=105358 RepID=UPI003A850A08
MNEKVFENENEVIDAYTRVRSDENEETWMLLKYEGTKVTLTGTGLLYDEFLAKLGDDDRAYGYVRVETGDEMSKRAKFILITWIGANVSAMKKAKVSTDKGSVKRLLSDFAVEKLIDDKDDLSFDKIKDEVVKAGGANYGTGKRD